MMHSSDISKARTHTSIDSPFVLRGGQLCPAAADSTQAAQTGQRKWAASVPVVGRHHFGAPSKGGNRARWEHSAGLPMPSMAV